MNLDRFFSSPVGVGLINKAESELEKSGPVDLSRATELEITRDTYMEAQSRGITLSDLLETDEYDASPAGCL